MAKRSQRRPLRYEKDRTGCISGLISIFDFRHGRTTRKLLSDSRKRGSELDVGSACSSSMQELPNPSDNRLTIEDNEGSEVAVPDPRTSVKKLMEEEMINEQSLKNQGNDFEIDAEEFDSQKSWRSRKNSRRTRRASNTHSHDFDSEAPCRQDFGGTALEDLDIVMEELRQIHQKNRKFVKLRQGLHNDHNKQSDQTHPVVEEKVNAAIEVFINQRSRNNKQLGEDNKTLQSKEFMDALQTLSSNKDFILRLLQDPNSRLVKQIGSLDEAQFEEKRKPNLISQSNMSEENRVHAKTDDVINHKQRKFFRRRSKSQEVYPPMGDETPRPSSKIVILKPGPAGLQSSSAQINVNTPVERTMQNERNTSQFSFTEIKRKLRHAMGKDRHGISPEGTIRRLPSEQLKRSNSERGISGENLGWSSPNRDHFYTEKFAKSPLGMKRGDKIVKSKGVEAVTPTEASDFPRPGMSNIYIEAKKHLVEMLDNENETTEVSSRQVPKSLGRILSFAEYNSSPGCSPREKSKDGMVPSQMREPLTGPKQDENDNRLQPVQEDHAMGPSPSSQDLEIESSCSDKYPNECTKSASTVLDVTCENGNTLNENAATTGDISPEGDLTEEAIKTRCQEECEILSAPIDREIQVDRDAINAVEDGSPSHGFELSFDCLKEHPSGKDEKTLSSPSASPADSSSPRKVEDPESVSVDRKERPSPVSVLEPLFAEDDVSPSSTICRPVDPEIQPRKIHFEEPVSSISEQDCPTVCFENEESAFEYVEAVLLGSGLSWDEFLLRWLSSDQPRNESPPPEEEQLSDEENEILGDERSDVASNESGEDLFGDDYERDYEAIDELDRYEGAGIDDDEENDAEMTVEERRRAEREIKRREREKRRRLGQHLNDESDFDDEEELIGLSEKSKRTRRTNDDEIGMDDETDAYIKNLGDTQGHKIADWIQMPGPHNEVIRHLKKFLRTFKITNDTIGTTNKPIYREALRRLVQEQKQSIIIDFEHLMSMDEVLAFFLLGAPEQTLKIFHEALTELCFELYPNHRSIEKELFVRVSNCLQNDNIRDLRVEHLNKLIGISGVVTTSTGVLPQLSIIKFNCQKCGFTLGPFTQNQENEIKPGSCPECQSNGPFELNMEETLYRNYQRISIQESPGTVPPGRIPRSKEILLLGDLCDTCRPGDEIEVLGVYRNTYNISLNIQNNLPVFATIIEANYISTREDKISFETLTDEDIQEIQRLAKDPKIAQRIYASIAPSIYGHEMVKKSIAFAMFGGEPKNPGGKHQVRGDINILLCGDPSTAKSQFLKYIEKTAHRAVFTTGRGASAVGLTAYVQRNAVTREWTLEAGALVLADRGVCLIDEFDKMSDQDRTSIHEAMEQQSISISKAGIVTTLQARCAVIAAANPVGGRYDPALTFMDNVDLSEPILTRFDILCTVRDIADPVQDELMARFVTESHMRHHPSADENDAQQNHVVPNIFNVEPIPQETFKKYLIYAKRRIHPRMTSVDQEKVAQLYAKLRRESLITGSVPVTVRQIESMVRIAEAHARMHLRDFVNDDDINVAIQIVLQSFIDAQKYGIMRTMKKVFQRYLTYKKDNNEFLLFLLKQLFQEHLAFQRNRYGADRVVTPGASIKISEEDLKSRARQYSVLDLKQFYESPLFRSHGFKYEDKFITQVL